MERWLVGTKSLVRTLVPSADLHREACVPPSGTLNSATSDRIARIRARWISVGIVSALYIAPWVWGDIVRD